MFVDLNRNEVTRIANTLDPETLMAMAYFQLREVYYDNYLRFDDEGGYEENPWAEEATQFYALQRSLGLTGNYSEDAERLAELRELIS